MVRWQGRLEDYFLRLGVVRRVCGSAQCGTQAAERDGKGRDRRIARITFPIWVYVSITGVLVYLLLFKLYGPAM